MTEHEIFLFYEKTVIVIVLFQNKTYVRKVKKKNNIPPYTKVIHRTHWRHVYVGIQNERHTVGRGK